MGEEKPKELVVTIAGFGETEDGHILLAINTEGGPLTVMEVPADYGDAEMT